MTQPSTMRELTAVETDAVTGGAPIVAGGLVNVNLSDINVDILRNANIDVIDDVTVTLRDIANNNNVGVGALINVLGGPSAIVGRQTQ